MKYEKNIVLAIPVAAVCKDSAQILVDHMKLYHQRISTYQ